jgi:hypothetical protein
MPQPQQTATIKSKVTAPGTGSRFYGKAPDEASRSGILPAIIEGFAAVSRETAAKPSMMAGRIPERLASSGALP